MSDGIPRANWLGLSPELWGHIFTHLKPDQEDLLAVKAWSTPSTASFYRISEVCTTFHQIFQTASCLHTSLSLRRQPSSSSFVSLSRYIRKHQSSMQTLVAGYDSPWMETALGLLIDAPISKIYMANVSLPALHLMTEFRSITHCIISEATIGELGFALGLLPNLTNLTLKHGVFTGVDAAVNLTSLKLKDCTCTCNKDSRFATSLLELQLECSDLFGFQPGVCSCPRLQYLLCYESVVDSSTDADVLCFEEDNFNVPSNLSMLLALTKLDFRIAPLKDHLQLDWLTELKGLVSVDATLFADTTELPEDLSVMVNLKTLQVYCCPEPEHESVLNVRLDWVSLVSLESLTLHSDIIHHRNLNGLSSLKSLKHIQYSCKPSTDSTQQLLELSRKLGSSGPDIDFNHFGIYD